MGQEQRSGVVTRTLQVDISPEECAAAFLDFSSDQQAEILNRIADKFGEGVGWGMQLGHLTAELSDRGKQFFEEAVSWWKHG